MADIKWGRIVVAIAPKIKGGKKIWPYLDYMDHEGLSRHTILTSMHKLQAKKRPKLLQYQPVCFQFWKQENEHDITFIFFERAVYALSGLCLSIDLHPYNQNNWLISFPPLISGAMATTILPHLSANYNSWAEISFFDTCLTINRLANSDAKSGGWGRDWYLYYNIGCRLHGRNRNRHAHYRWHNLQNCTIKFWQLMNYANLCI